MPTTNTERMRQIADDLRSDGAHTAANSVDEITSQRDELLDAIRPFLLIEERATHSYGQVWASDIAKAREIADRIANETSPR